MEWLSQQYRMTVFPMPDTKFEPREMWQDGMGKEPDTITEKPREGLYSYSLINDSIQTVFDVKPTRFDFRHDGIFDSSSSTASFSVLGTLEETIDSFVAQAIAMLSSSSCPVFYRLAFGAKIVIPVEEKERGYEILDGFIKDVKLDPINSSDFIYRINKPRQSGLLDETIKLNRLCTWRIDAIGLSTFTVEGNRLLQSHQEPAIGAVAEIDVNTHQDDPKPLPDDKKEGLLKELVDLAMEIAEKGDVA